MKRLIHSRIEVLVAAIALAGTASHASQAATLESYREPAVRIVADAAGSAWEADQVRKVLSGYGPLLALLPLAKLDHVALEEATLVVYFDFDGAKSCRIDVAGEPCWVLDKKGRPKLTKAAGHEFKIKRRLRFELDEHGIVGIHEGDIKVGWTFGWADLSMRTQRTSTKTVRDSDGRPVLETDESGRPVQREGRYVERVASRWILLEAKGRTSEVAIEEAYCEPVVASR